MAITSKRGIYVFGVTALVLAGCGGAGDEGLIIDPGFDPAFDPDVQKLGTLPEPPFLIRIDGEEIEFDYSGSLTDAEVFSALGFDLGDGFYGNDAGRDNVVFFAAPTGNGIAVAINSFGDIFNLATAGIYVEQLNENVTMPTAGNFTFSGAYRGMVGEDQRGSGNNSLQETYGTVRLIGTFGGMISGTISERTLYDPPGAGGVSVPDISLLSTSIVNGVFVGNVTSSTNSVFPLPRFGEYTGIFTGDSADEILGGLGASSADGIYEWGIFYATEDP